MSTPTRILVIGPSGAGKSTLARAIGVRMGLPVTHLDALFWQPGWVEGDEAVFRAKIAAVAATNAWVIDGNYTRHLDLRLARAHAVIWLDLPRHVYFPRAVWRSIRNYGRERGDVGIGNPERFDVSFFKNWVWTYPTRGRAKQAALMASLPAAITARTLTSRRQVAAFVRELPQSLASASM
jgi:adenylate kinase family enzyme